MSGVGKPCLPRLECAPINPLACRKLQPEAIVGDKRLAIAIGENPAQVEYAAYKAARLSVKDEAGRAAEHCMGIVVRTRTEKAQVSSDECAGDFHICPNYP